MILLLKRQPDRQEGHAYLRVRSDFSSIADQLLNWAFSSEQLIGLTLNQLSELETNLQIGSLNGRLMLNRK